MKTSALAVLVTTLGVCLSQAQPTNDMFVNRTLISGTTIVVTGSNDGATVEPGEPDHALSFGGASIWWTWTAPANCRAIISTAGSTFNTLLGVYTGSSVSALTEVASNDDDPGQFSGSSKVTFDAIANQTYQIAVDGSLGSLGDVQLALTAGIPPPNDMFANSTPITGTNIVLTGSNVLATSEPGEPDHAFASGAASVWWTWTAPDNYAVTISTAGSSFNTVLGVYTGSSVSALTAVAGNDDAAGVSTSKVVFGATANHTYHVAVDGYGGDWGTVQLELTVGPPPPNDRFSSSTLITGTDVVLTGSNVGATKEPGEPDHSIYAGGASVWWTWTAPGNHSVILSTAGSSFNTQLAVYTGSSVSSLTLVANNEDTPGGMTSKLAFIAVANQTYHIVVDGYGGASGDVRLALTAQPPFANDMFVNRTRISGTSVVVIGSNAGATKEPGEPNHGNSPGGASVWWTWTPLRSHAVTLSTSGSSFLTLLAVYTGSSVSALTVVTSSAELGGKVAFSAIANQTYHIAVDGYNGAWGAVQLQLDAGPWVRTETAVEAWVRRYDGPGGFNDEASAVAVDSSDNVIVAGTSSSSTTLWDYTTIKYSSAGVPLWTRRHNGPGNSNDEAQAMALDHNNNVIVTGMDVGDGTAYDFATVKYSSDGVLLWTARYSGPPTSARKYDVAWGVAVDSSNNVIVTGYSDGAAASAISSEYLTIKYSSAGEPLWTNRYNGPGSPSWGMATAVAVDRGDNVIVTGTSSRSDGIGVDCATIKYSGAGQPLWTNRYPGGPFALAMDSNDEVIVGGGTTTIKYSSAGEPLWTNFTISGVALALDASNNVVVTGGSLATVKYSSAGEPLWTNLCNPNPGQPGRVSRAVAIDHNNDVLVTGYSSGAQNADYVTIKYSSAGQPLWTNRYNGPANGGDDPTAVAIDSRNNVIVTGGSYGVGSSGQMGSDFLTVKYVCVPSVPPPFLTGLQLANGNFQLQVEDVLQPGTLVIEASADLGGWAPVFTNATPTNPFLYTVPNAGSPTRRYYRAFQLP
ncbi:MAG TPA: hypothetical protein VJA21_17370 [Verrucomicrobiae bacterium]